MNVLVTDSLFIPFIPFSLFLSQKCVFCFFLHIHICSRTTMTIPQEMYGSREVFSGEVLRHMKGRCNEYGVEIHAVSIEVRTHTHTYIYTLSFVFLLLFLLKY
jgi:hypothetical protein